MSGEESRHQARRSRNIAMLVILSALAILIFAVTLVKLGAIGAPG